MPDSGEWVTCGKYARDSVGNGRAIGRFVYGRSYRSRPDAVALDPVHLPLSDRQYETVQLDGVFGVLRDSAPDAWGRMVLQRRAGHTVLDEMDFLLRAGPERAGALSFGLTKTSDPVNESGPPIQRLDELLAAAERMESETDLDQLTADDFNLLAQGSSMGGARPKSVLEHDNQLWIAKFPSKGDRWNNARVEAGLLALAAKCGIDVPVFEVHELENRSVLLVKRFDRSTGRHGQLRSRMASALTIVDGDESPAERKHWSYLLLADEFGRWCHDPANDRLKLFRRMVFNALVSNIDDHPRNHAVIAPQTSWSLSPAYDITPAPQPSSDRYLAMDCGLHGRIASRANLLSGCGRFGLNVQEASQLIYQLQDTVAKTWRKTLQENHVTAADLNTIESAFLPPGLEFEGSAT